MRTTTAVIIITKDSINKKYFVYINNVLLDYEGPFGHKKPRFFKTRAAAFDAAFKYAKN
jgi:hypothetical protein